MVSLEYDLETAMNQPITDEWDYRIGDTLTFHHLVRDGKEIQWLVVEISEKIYTLVNLWDPEEIWHSHRRAFIHYGSGPSNHYRNGKKIR